MPAGVVKLQQKESPPKRSGSSGGPIEGKHYSLRWGMKEAEPAHQKSGLLTDGQISVHPGNMLLVADQAWLVNGDVPNKNLFHIEFAVSARRAVLDAALMVGLTKGIGGEVNVTKGPGLSLELNDKARKVAVGLLREALEYEEALLPSTIELIQMVTHGVQARMRRLKRGKSLLSAVRLEVDWVYYKSLQRLEQGVKRCIIKPIDFRYPQYMPQLLNGAFESSRF